MYKNDSVGKVNKYAYYHCNWTATAGTTPANKDASSLFLLDAPGFVYFASTDAKHCKRGQRLMLNVRARTLPPSAPPADAPAPPPVARPPSSAQGAPSPGEPVAVDSAAAVLASSSGSSLVLGVCLAVLALVGLIRA
jgi:hypothetical protein